MQLQGFKCIKHRGGIEAASGGLKGVIEIFTKFTGKHLCLSFRSANLLKEKLWHSCFPVNFVKFLRTPLFTENSSRPEVFCKTGVLKNFLKCTRKDLCQSLFFNKVADLRAATLLKRGLWNRCFPLNFKIFLRTPLVAASAQNTSGRLLLEV